MANTTQPGAELGNTQEPTVSSPAQETVGDELEQTDATDEKPRKRDFFRFGRKEDDKKKTKTTSSGPTLLGSPGGLRPVSPLVGLDNTRSQVSPVKNSPYGVATSPRNMRSASPRTHSPASSMIFERNVQEDVSIPQASPSIPSHIITENHIPPALDATSEAITDKKLDPDAVEIVTHAQHQPAAVTITGGLHDMPASPIVPEDPHAPASPIHRQETDSLSNYASLDSTDVRRLSFISFADVVHAEHDLVESRRESTNAISHVGMNAPRSPSPMRSPVSSAPAAGSSPPTSVSPSGLEVSPHRGLLGELNVETMRQALRKTESGDLSGFRSTPMSAVGNDDGTTDKSFR